MFANPFSPAVSALFSKKFPRIICGMAAILFASAHAFAATPPCTLDPTQPSVTICTPAPNATVTSPVHVVAGTNSSPAATLIQIYLDGHKVYESKTSQLDTTVTMTAGSHRLTVQAFNGSYFKSTINVVASAGTAVSVGVSPSTATISTGAQQQFTATVQNTSNTSVTWAVDGETGGDAGIGTISSSGLYTAPGTAGNHVVKATSVADTTASGTANVTVQSSTGSCTASSTQPSVTICTPAPNASVTSPVHVVATSNSSPVVSTMQIYLDGKAVYTVKAPKLDTSISATAGAHRLTVQASNGTIFKSTENITVTVGPPPPPPPPSNFENLTYKNDLGRIGLNNMEYVLTPGTVNSTTFGKKYSYTLDGSVYNQPLFKRGVSINGHTYNVIYIATEHGSVYAFDADGSTTAPLWKTSFIDPANNITTVASCSGCGRTSLGPEVGVTGTPVIDPVSQTLYVSMMTSESGITVHRLHALDITTGIERVGSPVQIQASVPGTGTGNDGNGQVPFDSTTSNQRPGLLLLNGVVYVTFAAYSDIEPYHGWVFAYDAQTLNQLAVLNVSPNTSAGGIWMGGCGPSADTTGNLYVMTGNGHYNGTKEWGQTILKLALSSGAIKIVDWFTPFDWQSINSSDLDMGSGCPALLPDQSGTHPHLLIAGAKNGKIYVINRDNMGHNQTGSDSQVLQSLNLNPSGVTSGTRPRMYSSLAYWNGYVYFAPANTVLRAYSLSDATLTLSSQAASNTGSRGGIPIVSSNGNSNGVVWMITRDEASGTLTLHAYDGMDVSKQLYTTAQNATRDAVGAGGPFATPMIVDGKVFVPAKLKLVVYGSL
jgi:Big-like domain-containing protein